MSQVTNEVASTEQEVSATPAQKVQVSVSDILTELINGSTRAQIAAKFGMPKAVLNRMMQHPKLAGHRPKKSTGFELVDDEGDVLAYPKPKAAKKKVAAPAEAEEVATPAPGNPTTDYVGL